ncbi:hypothetical protein ACFPK1_15770 [Actinomycetospora rhizophila]|uniref:Uncharacterized protein n=1 Tax=Actinomycetospora rhizophila TaxID=1416876 RepID=A0ABV9ZE72_9PSEU
MFRTLARLLAPAVTDPPNADGLYTIHPLQLSRWLEEVWAHGGQASWPGFGTSPTGVTATTVQRVALPTQPGTGLLGTLPSGVDVPGQFSPPPALGIVPGVALPWDHLVYAFLVESTGVAEVTREVVRRYSVGETLEAVSDVTYSWLRATEELFFRDPPLFSVTSTVSTLRPDHRLNRRNAYWRMFGMDLPHPPSGVDGQPWKTDVGPTANLGFGTVWIDFLRQVWVAIENDSNAVGANPTDSSYIAYLARTLQEMMAMRRRAGMLAREEFTYVVTMSWFHLLVETDNRVVADLQAGVGAAGNAADRLARIAQRVGIEPPRRARELFELADLVSPVLMFIEAGRFNDAADAELLYRSASPSPAVRETMNRLIDLWQSATGQVIKGADVRTHGPAAPAQPLRLHDTSAPVAPAAPVSTASTNGTGPPVAPVAGTNGVRPPARL